MPETYAPADDLTPAQRLVLFELEDIVGGVRLDDLGQRTGLPKRTLRDALSRLEADGWVDRQPDPGDPRRRLVALTA